MCSRATNASPSRNARSVAGDVRPRARRRFGIALAVVNLADLVHARAVDRLAPAASRAPIELSLRVVPCLLLRTRCCPRPTLPSTTAKADRIVQPLLTPRHGRVSAIARAARNSKRRFAGSLEVSLGISASWRSVAGAGRGWVSARL